MFKQPLKILAVCAAGIGLYTGVSVGVLHNNFKQYETPEVSKGKIKPPAGSFFVYNLQYTPEIYKDRFISTLKDNFDNTVFFDEIVRHHDKIHPWINSYIMASVLAWKLVKGNINRNIIFDLTNDENQENMIPTVMSVPCKKNKTTVQVITNRKDISPYISDVYTNDANISIIDDDNYPITWDELYNYKTEYMKQIRKEWIKTKENK